MQMKNYFLLVELEYRYRFQVLQVPPTSSKLPIKGIFCFFVVQGSTEQIVDENGWKWMKSYEMDENYFLLAPPAAPNSMMRCYRPTPNHFFNFHSTQKSNPYYSIISMQRRVIFSATKSSNFSHTTERTHVPRQPC